MTNHEGPFTREQVLDRVLRGELFLGTSRDTLPNGDSALLVTRGVSLIPTEPGEGVAVDVTARLLYAGRVKAYYLVGDDFEAVATLSKALEPGAPAADPASVEEVRRGLPSRDRFAD